MTPIRRLCVYCGSRTGSDPKHAEAAATLGRGLAQAGITLVYGGGRIGLMGILADAVLAGGGKVIGIIPSHLHAREVAHEAVELQIVGNMHDRKRVMAEEADAFAVLPGGLGTLDEAFEIITWRLLGLHDKPILLVDIAGYWAPLQALLAHLSAQDFAAADVGRFWTVVPDIRSLMAALLGGAADPNVAMRPDLL